jgi:hypothetical protein
MRPLYLGLIVLILALCYMIYKKISEGFTNSDKLYNALDVNNIDDVFTEKVFGRILYDIIYKFKTGGSTTSDISDNATLLNKFMTDASTIYSTTNAYNNAYKKLLGRIYLDLSGSNARTTVISKLYKDKFTVDISNSVTRGISAEQIVANVFGLEGDAGDLAYFSPSANSTTIICKTQTYQKPSNAFINNYLSYIKNTSIKNKLTVMTNCTNFSGHNTGELTGNVSDDSDQYDYVRSSSGSYISGSTSGSGSGSVSGSQQNNSTYSSADMEAAGEIIKIIEDTLNKLPVGLLTELSQKYEKIRKESNDKFTRDSFNKVLELLEKTRPYYNYVGITFDEAKIKLLDLILKDIIKNNIASQEEKQLAAILIDNEIKKIQTSIQSVQPIIPSGSIATTSKLQTGSLYVESGSEIMEKIRPYIKKEFEDADLKNDVRRLVEKIGKSPSEEQGSEFNKQRVASCDSLADNDDYIRKDSIPCWSCNLPR